MGMGCDGGGGVGESPATCSPRQPEYKGAGRVWACDQKLFVPFIKIKEAIQMFSQWAILKKTMEWLSPGSQVYAGVSWR